jgi:hypothetical protein
MNSVTKPNYSPFINTAKDSIPTPQNFFSLLHKKFFHRTTISPPPLNRKHTPLITKELQVEDRQSIIKTIDAWKHFAQSKATQLPKPNIFYDSKDLCKWISHDLNKDLQGTNIRIFVCTDPIFNELQAIALVTDYPDEKKPYFYLELLATHPKNINSPLNLDEPNPIAGAATSLISHLKSVGIEENRKKIKLCSLQSATGFYRKMGFKTKNSEEFTLKL